MGRGASGQLNAITRPRMVAEQAQYNLLQQVQARLDGDSAPLQLVSLESGTLGGFRELIPAAHARPVVDESETDKVAVRITAKVPKSVYANARYRPLDHAYEDFLNYLANAGLSVYSHYDEADNYGDDPPVELSTIEENQRSLTLSLVVTA